MVITGGITGSDLKDTKKVDGKAAIVGWRLGVWGMCRAKLAYICGGTVITAYCLCLLGGW